MSPGMATNQPGDDARDYVTIRVLGTQLQALREAFGHGLSDDEIYSAAAIAVLVYLPSRSSTSSSPSSRSSPADGQDD